MSDVTLVFDVILNVSLTPELYSSETVVGETVKNFVIVLIIFEFPPVPLALEALKR